MSEPVEDENVFVDSSDAAVDPTMHIRDAIGDPFSKLRTRLFSPLPPASPGGVRTLRAPKMSEHTAMGFGLLGAQQASGARPGTAGAAGGLDCHSVDSSLVLAPGVTLGSDRGDDCNNDVSSIATDETGVAAHGEKRGHTSKGGGFTLDSALDDTSVAPTLHLADMEQSHKTAREPDDKTVTRASHNSVFSISTTTLACSTPAGEEAGEGGRRGREGGGAALEQLAAVRARMLDAQGRLRLREQDARALEAALAAERALLREARAALAAAQADREAALTQQARLETELQQTRGKAKALQAEASAAAERGEAAARAADDDLRYAL